jgi:hypothetical protein
MKKLIPLFALLSCLSTSAFADDAPLSLTPPDAAAPAQIGVTLPDGGRMMCSSPEMNAFLNDVGAKIVANWKASDNRATFLRRYVNKHHDGSIEIGFYIMSQVSQFKKGYYLLANIQASAGCAISD